MIFLQVDIEIGTVEMHKVVFTYKISYKRRRSGSTSPPLVGVEVNPGPRKVGRRKLAHEKAKNQRNKARKKLSAMDKGQILFGMKLNTPVDEIARLVNCSSKTVRRWRDRYIETNGMERKAGSGCPRKITPKDEAYLCIVSKRNRRKTAKALAAEIFTRRGKLTVSTRTVRRYLAKYNLNGRVARPKPLLRLANRQARIRFAKKYKNWRYEEWKQVIWTDETSFTLFSSCGKTYVRRRPGEDLLPECLVPTVKKGGGKVLCWGAFHAGGVGPLVKIDGIMDAKKFHGILTTHAMPYIKQLKQGERKIELKTGENKEEKDRKGRPDWIFQQDNDPKHTAKLNKRYMEKKKLERGFKLQVLDWPSQSPDLNPIEHVWQRMKYNLSLSPKKSSNAQVLWKAVQDEWEKFPVDYLENLVRSMPKRCQQVLKNKGGHTTY